MGPSARDLLLGISIMAPAPTTAGHYLARMQRSHKLLSVITVINWAGWVIESTLALIWPISTTIRYSLDGIAEIIESYFHSVALRSVIILINRLYLSPHLMEYYNLPHTGNKRLGRRVKGLINLNFGYSLGEWCQGLYFT